MRENGDGKKTGENGCARRDYLFQVWGWILFLACAVLFLVAAVENGDWKTALGSALFLISCVLFLVVLVGDNRRESRGPK